MRFRRAGAIAAVLTLSLPGAALAQSAGDDQYRDPFGEGQQQNPAPQDAGDTGQTAPGTSGQSAPAPAPTPAAAPTTGTEPTATVAGGTLPRTGLAAGLVALLGFLMLGAGFGLRRAAGRD